VNFKQVTLYVLLADRYSQEPPLSSLQVMHKFTAHMPT